MEEKTREILSDIGLGKIEVSVYLDLLANKSSVASDIAKRTKQHRSNVYDALKHLQQKGFVLEAVEEGKRLFEARNPEIILNYVQQKSLEIKDVLPFLETLTKRRKSNPNTISVSYGITNFRSLLLDIINHNQEFYVWGVPYNVEELGEGFIKDWDKQRVKRRVKSKILYTRYFPGMKNIERPFQEVRYVESNKSRTGVMIYGYTVLFMVFSKPLMVIEIRSREFARWSMDQFNTLWQSAKKPTAKPERRTTAKPKSEAKSGGNGKSQENGNGNGLKSLKKVPMDISVIPRSARQ